MTNSDSFEGARDHKVRIHLHSRSWRFRCCVANILLAVVRVIVPPGNNLRYFLSKKFLLHATSHPLDFQLDKYAVSHRLACDHIISAENILNYAICPRCMRHVKVLSHWSSDGSLVK